LFFGLLILFLFIQEELGLNTLSTIFLGVIFVGIYILILAKGGCVPTQLYVLTKFSISLSRSEADYLSSLFSSGNRPGKWYPLDNLNTVPINERKQTLFAIAQKIIGYSYEKSIEMKNAIKNNRQKKFKKPIINTSNNKEYFSTADEIARFKKLLDDGAITIDEYEKKKKVLLNL
jgi:hypothetical protein